MNTRYLQLSQHSATGVILTDSSLRFVTLTQHNGAAIPSQYGELSVPEGCIKNSSIVSKGKLISFLRTFRKTYKVESINLVLNSEQIKTVSVSVKGGIKTHGKESIEKLFGLAAKDIVYESRAIGGDHDTAVLQVTGIAKKVSEDMVFAFKQAGITVLSIEPVGHALVRATLPVTNTGTSLVINVDTRGTALAYAVNGRVSDIVPLEFSDVGITKSIMDQLLIGPEAADKAKREQGLNTYGSRAVFDAIADECALLVKHINHSYVEWKTAHPALPPLDMIYLTGAGSLIKGLDEYIAVGLKVPVKVGNVWVNCLSFDEHIPIMPQQEAVRYGAAIGTTLIGSHMVNLIPDAHQRSLRRKHVARRSGKVFLSFVLGVLVGVAIARIIAIPQVHSKIFEVLHKI